MNVLLQGPVCVKAYDCVEAPACTLFTLGKHAMLPKTSVVAIGLPGAVRACVPPSPVPPLIAMVITSWPLRVTAIQTMSIQGGRNHVCVCLEGLLFFSHTAAVALSGPINPLLSTRMAPHYRALLMSSPFWWVKCLWKHVGALHSFRTSGGTMLTDLIVVL